MTYNNIIALFRRFAEAHDMVNDFYEGEIVEVDDGGNYPFIYPLYTGSTYEDNSENLNFEVYVMENALTKKDDIAQQRNAVSDCKQIAEDIIADIRNGGNIFVFDDQVDLEDYSLTPAIDVRTQTLTGVILNLTIAIPFTANACVLPLEGVTPTSTDCADATYKNSDGSFEQSIGSGNIFVAADIEVEDVDGSTRQEPANQNVQCLFVPLEIVNSEGDNIFDDVDTFPAGAQIEIPDFAVRDKDGNVITVPAANSIQLPAIEVTGASTDANGELTINTPAIQTASGILYQQMMPQHFRTSYNVGDSAWHWQNGSYERTRPTFPQYVAEIDYTAVQSDVRAIPATGTTANDSVSPTILKQPNAFGNRYRFTDSAGNPSDSTANTLFAHTDWLNHSFSGAKSDYIIDHLFGLGQITRYIEDGSKRTLAVNDPDGQSIDDWIAYVHSLNFKGYSDWRLPDLTTSRASILGANFFPNSSEWAGKTFFAERPDNRFSAALCEAAGSSVYLQLNDSNGSIFPIYRVGRTQDLGFGSDICHVFPQRNHY